MHLKSEYQNKLVLAEEAVQVIESGDWIDYGFGLTGPYELDKALARRKDELFNVNIRNTLGLWPHFSIDSDPTGEHFTLNTWHFSSAAREFYSKGLAYYIPMKFNELPMLTRNDCIPARVFMASVSPMDNHGFFSFGVGAAGNMASIENAEYVILEVNENIPRVLGGNQENIHISQVNFVVEGPNPELLTLPATEPSETDKKIAQNIIHKLYDGCCIQLGIGGIPSAVGNLVAQSDLKDLGVHTEMYVDAYIKMTKAGKITGLRKSIDKYKQVFSFALGSQELYEFIDDNPGVAAYSVDYTNNPYIISQIDDFVSINACIEVDLFGQVSSETVGTRHISGTGGQVDFVEGAYRSKNGQSFICMPSTYKTSNQVTSRIKPILAHGTVVTGTRSATHMIVTEYGIANMKGKSTWERAEALINISHPSFRDELIKEASAMKIWRKSNKIK
ncbi:4-hydroxybutyrate coenzyme A transferase [Candidatus Syntrophocurvum alkaliphilum]|uniref:Probable butyrate:acetyl-CoA coenzyme A-transferase n=1 Tax=Candidatus Syntrophocurvum alkaliphilum TaxID=2293317 RepID=A0A6I6DIC4_9FIRM|nr:acetyl-CoA hydrolase/transferase C-terminal domain-containing protein [Candidatus Syntrophocurvum alkaliphilum]QGT99644.1 4-hydroxybutyrate coenzyme A transferase [Candidatus Syntrophocurvum alkaliphilum]